MENNEKLILVYKKEKSHFESFLIKIESLIKELLLTNKMNPHQIISRCKSIESLEKKIDQKESKYEELEDVTDLAGIRIITYFEDEVDRIAEIIQKEFRIDSENSIDKRKLESDRFGYKSLHFVANLNDDRGKLTEYKSYRNKKIEIQIRSILQHAWAEIEHDIGYKGIYSIPDFAKRDFFRIAALLELADKEFVRLKKELKQYEIEVPQIIRKTPKNVYLDRASLVSFITTNDICYKIDKEIVAVTNSKLLSNDEFYNVEDYLQKLVFLEVLNIKDLDENLQRNQEKIVAFAKLWNSGPLKGSFPRGIALFYLAYVLVGEKQSIEFAKNYYKVCINNSENSELIVNSAQRILNIYNQLIKI